MNTKDTDQAKENETSEPKVLTPGSTQTWELGGLDLPDAYLIMVPGWQMTVRDMGDGRFYFKAVLATDRP